MVFIQNQEKMCILHGWFHPENRQMLATLADFFICALSLFELQTQREVPELETE